MLRILAAAAGLALTAFSSAALADAPWERGQPKGMTQSHAQIASHVQGLIRSGADFGMDPNAINWRVDGGMYRTQPVSNVTARELKRAMTGRYLIYWQSVRDVKVQYLHADGRVFSCDFNNGARREWVGQYYIRNAETGFAGYFMTDRGVKATANATGFPVIYESSNRGAFHTYVANRKGKWFRRMFWLQDEIPEVAARRCENLPNNGNVNAAQTRSRGLEMWKNANPYEGTKAAFSNDHNKPLTAEMLYWAYPPNS